ncbi:MAG: GNAT family N-acetyltransferase [Paludibacteraceae bacterium]|nr:GNAT family N-acetyltransferase [Paludibacteraceae bacterium]
MLHADDISLRKLEPTDLPFLYQWENDSRSWADSDIHNPLSQKDLRDYIESSTGDIYKDGQLRLIIESVSDNSTLGCIDLFDFDPHNRKAAVGMYLAEAARGKGVGKMVVRLLEEYAFSFLNMRMLYIFVAENNTACIRLYKSLGWDQTASLKEWLNTGNVVVLQRMKQ